MSNGQIGYHSDSAHLLLTQLKIHTKSKIL